MIEIKSGYGKLEINNSPEARARFERMRKVLTADRGVGDSYTRCANSPGFNPCDFRYAVKIEDLGLPSEIPRNIQSKLYD